MFKLLCIALLPLIGAEYLYGDNAYNYNTAYASGYDNYKPRDYKFEYGVSDPHTGDHKSQWEVRENGVVRGAYSLLEADGTTRLVEYYADDTGFHADVKKIGTAVHDSPDHGITPIIKTEVADSIAYNGYGHGGLEHTYGAPIAAVQHAAPIAIAHEAPIAKVEAIEPVHQLIAPQVHTIQEYAQVPVEKFAPIHKYEQVVPIQKYAEYVPEIVQPVQKYAYNVAPVQQGHYIQEVVKSAPQIHHIPTEYIQQAPQQHYIQEAPQTHYIQEVQQPHYTQEVQQPHYTQEVQQYTHEVQQPHYAQEVHQPHYVQEVVKHNPVPVHYTQEVQQPHYIQEVVKHTPAPVQYSAPLPLPKYNEIPSAHYPNQVTIENYAPLPYLQAPATHVEPKLAKIQNDFYSDAGIYYQPAKPELAAYHSPSQYTYAGH